MTNDEFFNELTNMSGARENRLKYAEMVLKDMTLFPKLLDISLLTNSETSSRALWVLEFVCLENLNAVIPFLEVFTNNLKNIHLESSIRPTAKICALITEAYTSKETNEFKKVLTTKHKEHIIESCFDWLINDHKVASKVHAMQSLFFLGLETSWIHPELIQILKRDFHHQSAAFKSRSRHILNKIKKHKNL
ncbi:adenylosuccinate lyase [Aestuariibaculum sediminum]|uniref:Adenylosuccinate lyase n=1 Tax=Aestuariibaculum sediminum TaxID=2770637 RepID=A0A8J6Q0G0_9FLAO|nr:adenylosuccinate lyase [Aestuariibaculum sediminum]MBD0833153.1 adenylosuccinate lyase [Aestuariibaculum sediminum]